MYALFLIPNVNERSPVDKEVKGMKEILKSGKNYEFMFSLRIFISDLKTLENYVIVSRGSRSILFVGFFLRDL